MIDRTVSVANLAKLHLRALDKSSLDTWVQTEELRLMLTTLVELAEKPRPEPLPAKTVMSLMDAVRNAQVDEETRRHDQEMARINGKQLDAY